MRRGFLLGKFMPPHAGHIAMCRMAAGMVDQLTVMVCTRTIEPVPGDLRTGWMRALLPGVRIAHYDRDIPQEPADHPDFWDIWRTTIRALHPERIDQVFGSEPYVHRLASELGGRPVLVDPARTAFPVSASAVRSNPPGNWPHIPGPVRPAYQKRVVTFGPESVGKSTLAHRLAEHYGGPFVPEYGRTYDENRADIPWDAAQLLEIAEGHEAHRAAIAPEAGPILIEDTDPLLTSVWAHMLLGAPLAALEQREQGDLYLLLDASVPFVQDGGRYFDDDAGRQDFFARCKALLERVGARHVVIAGDWDTRLAQAIAAVDALRAEPFPPRWDRQALNSSKASSALAPKASDGPPPI